MGNSQYNVKNLKEDVIIGEKCSFELVLNAPKNGKGLASATAVFFNANSHYIFQMQTRIWTQRLVVLFLTWRAVLIFHLIGMRGSEQF